MKQYRFTDTTRPPVYDRTGIEITIDGVTLDRAIEGYQTLTVQGRELVGRDIESRNYKTIRAGKKTQTSRNYRASLAPNTLLSSNLTSRTLVITYELKAPSEWEFRRLWELMNLLINKEEVPISFSDDPDFYYIGTLSQIEEVNPDSNHVHSSFQIECMDPFKYRKREQTWSFFTAADFPQVAEYPVVIEEVRITPRVAAWPIRISNETTGAFLQIDRQFTAGTAVVIDLVNIEAHTSTGVDLMPYHNVFSDFEDFSIELGERVSTNVAADVSITYRRRML